jgi:lipoprotein NlpI
MEKLNGQAALIRPQPSHFAVVARRSPTPNRGAVVALALLQAFAVGCHAQLAVDADKCEKNVNSNPDLAVQGCTALVTSGQLSAEDLAKVFNDRGLAYSNKAKYDLAIQDFDKALSLKPDTVEALNNRGLAFEQKGDFDRALQDYDGAIRLQPSYASALNNRGLLYRERKGDQGRALQDFDEAIRLRPDYAEAISNRAHSYYAKGDYDRAIADFDQAVKLEPNYTGNLFDRAAAFNSKKDYGRALADLNHAIELSPKDPALLWARGVTLFFLGQFEPATNNLARSLELRRDDPYCAIWLYLARSKGDKSAKDELRKNSDTVKFTGWPLPAIQMYLGTVSAREVLASAKDADERKNRTQLCQAYFYLGEDALASGKLSDAKLLFRQSAATKAVGAYECIGAFAELDRLNAPSQRAR